MKHHELDHSWSFQVPKIHQASFLRWTCDSQGSENSKRLLYNSGGDRPQGHITSCSQRSQWSRGKWCLTVIEIFRTMREMCRSGWNRTIPIKGKHHVFLKTRNCHVILILRTKKRKQHGFQWYAAIRRFCRSLWRFFSAYPNPRVQVELHALHFSISESTVTSDACFIQ